MPELPEVEVLRRSLEPRLVGARIDAVEVRERRLRETVDTRALRRHAAGRRVLAVRRRAKYLLVDLEGGSTLLLHLGMSGRLTVVPASAPPVAHEHVAFDLGSRGRLRFVDPRRFGLVAACPTDGLAADPRLAALGVEPLAGELDGPLLQRHARRRRGPVKPFLMDAGVVVGVGNIYASEALFAAGIDPRRSVGRLSAARWETLAVAIREVLARAIEQGGTTLNDFVDGEGNAGYFQVSLAVYDREGQPCPRCGGRIRRLLQAGRSTYLCVRCQR